jgi:hypothetical protein
MDEIDNKLCGCVLALICGIPAEARGRVTEALEAFAEDRNTPLSEAMFYRDLADSIEPVQLPVGGLFELLETTLH